MPRTYKRKTITHYSQEGLEMALEEINNKNCSIYSSAKKYHIPYDTLRRWFTNPPAKKGGGRGTLLTKVEEQCIVRAIQFTASCGYPFDRSDLVNMVQGYLKSSGKMNLFPNNCPGPDWVRNFMRRWEKELGKGKTGILSNPRAKILTKRIIEEFFKKLESILNEHKLWDQPQRVFNADETRLCVTPVENKDADKKPQNTNTESATRRQNLYSVLFCVSAAGHYIAPLTVYRGKNLVDTWTEGGPDGAIYATTPSGWVQDSAFEKWFEMFLRSVTDMDLARPVLLIHNGQRCHLTYDTLMKAIDNQIIILCLPPNTSHAIQPLDVGVLRPLRLCWANIIKDWYRESNIRKVSNAVFPTLLGKLTEKFSKEHGIDGFRESGIFPPNKVVIDKRIMEYAVVHEELISDSEEIATNHQKPTTQAIYNSGPSTSKSHQSVVPIISSVSIASTLTHTENARSKNAFSPVQIMAQCLMKNTPRKRTCRQMKSSEEVFPSNRSANKSLLEEINQDIECINLTKKVIPKSEISSEEESCSNTFSDDQNLRIGKWVEVKFPLKKTTWTYVGIIISQDNRDYTVKFAKKSGSYFIFPENEDICQVDESQIVRVLCDPLMDNRGHYIFS